MANLCGALDENLKQVETALDVTISRRGERFSLHGDSAQTQIAAEVLRRFYNQSRHHLSLEQVQLGLIEVRNADNLRALKKESRPVQTDGDAGNARTANAANTTGASDVADAAIQEASPALMTRRANLYGRTQRQTQYLKQIQQHDVTFAIGPAGTGKTYLAVASAVDALERELVSRLILVRPAVEAGERLGFLPGDMTQKVDPYLRPLYDALYDLMGFDKTNKQFERQTIEIAPLAFMRGRTLNQSFIILDEAQNTTPEQMKMFLTRIGFGSKTVVTGDITQIDLPKHQKSGLTEAKQVLNNIRGIAFTHFQSEDVVRHPLVQRIVDAYEKHDRKQQETTD